MHTDEIKQILQAHLSECDIDVKGDGSHFEVTVIGDVFEGLAAVKRQQLVYGGLNKQIADGSIHAVNMKIYTHTEWQRK